MLNLNRYTGYNGNRLQNNFGMAHKNRKLNKCCGNKYCDKNHSCCKKNVIRRHWEKEHFGKVSRSKQLTMIAEKSELEDETKYPTKQLIKAIHDIATHDSFYTTKMKINYSGIIFTFNTGSLITLQRGNIAKLYQYMQTSKN